MQKFESIAIWSILMNLFACVPVEQQVTATQKNGNPQPNTCVAGSALPTPLCDLTCEPGYVNVNKVCRAMDEGPLAIPTNVPAPAAAVAYNLQTWGAEVTLDKNWFAWNFYGAGAQAAGAAAQKLDGTLFISGNENNSYGATVATARQSNDGLRWTGTAFGGGAYFEAVLSFTGQGNGPYLNGGPAFWALDIEHTSQGPYVVNWPGEASNYNDFFEVDFMEYDVKEFSFQNGIGNWYGTSGQSTSNPVQMVPGAAGSVLVPIRTNFSEFHTYGCLWVPATPTTQGYLKFYFDGVQTSEPFVWNYNDPAHPFPAPPINNSTAMSGMDQRHMFLILGTGTTQPMTVKSVTVWQATAANNLTN